METDDRRAALLAAAGTLFEEKGVANTTIGDVTARVGVTRSLFYHYFRDKNALVDACVDLHVDDFMDSVVRWLGDESISGVREKITLVVGLLRSYLAGDNSRGFSVQSRTDDPLLQLFAVRSARRLADGYAAKIASGVPMTYVVGVRHPIESFYILVIGLVSLLNRKPDISDDELTDLILDTMQISDA